MAESQTSALRACEFIPARTWSINDRFRIVDPRDFPRRETSMDMTTTTPLSDKVAVSWQFHYSGPCFVPAAWFMGQISAKPVLEWKWYDYHADTNCFWSKCSARWGRFTSRLCQDWLILWSTVTRPHEVLRKVRSLNSNPGVTGTSHEVWTSNLLSVKLDVCPRVVSGSCYEDFNHSLDCCCQSSQNVGIDL